jgi:hypothetical protein
MLTCCCTTDEQLRRERTSSTLFVSQEPQRTLNKTGSWSTSANYLGTSGDHQNVRSRSPHGHLGGSSSNYGPSNAGYSYPSQIRVRRKWRALKFRGRQLFRMETLGHQNSAYLIVLILSVAGAAATGIAVWECSQTVTAVRLDSNFWSTLSQTSLGMGGLYCIVIPLFRRDNISANDPTLFKALLLLSLITAVLAVIIYHIQTRTSLVLACISGLAQLAATLQLIEDAGSTVKSLENTVEERGEIIDGQLDEISNLQEELVAARRRSVSR